MDAPVYPPAVAYVQPERLPQRLSVQDTPIATLRTVPAAWAIVLKEIPNMEQRVVNPSMAVHLGNFSLESLLPFGVVRRDVLDRIDPQLRALGQVK